MSEENNNALVAAGAVLPVLGVEQVATQVAVIQDMMKHVMKGPTPENQMGTHYGLIPGCGKKPTLLQPGAQIIGVTFQLYGEVGEHVVTTLDNLHREVFYKLNIVSRVTGKTVAIGVGNASTMESRYRYRQAEGKITDQPVPREYWDLRKSDPKKALDLLGGKGHGTKKTESGWMITIVAAEDKVENPDPSDYHNTVEKIAYKRAYVHGMINATGCSDIFTQDIEDMRGVLLASDHIEVSAPAYKEKAETPVAGTTVNDQPAEKPAEKPAPDVVEEKPDEKPAEEPPKDPTPDEDPANQFHGNTPDDPAILSADKVDKILKGFAKLGKYDQPYLENFVNLTVDKWTEETRLTLIAHHKVVRERTRG